MPSMGSPFTGSSLWTAIPSMTRWRSPTAAPGFPGAGVLATRPRLTLGTLAVEVVGISHVLQSVPVLVVMASTCSAAAQAEFGPGRRRRAEPSSDLVWAGINGSTAAWMNGSSARVLSRQHRVLAFGCRRARHMRQAPA